LQGFGCGAFWVIERTLAANDALEWYPRHSHNAYLQIIVNLGIVGLIISLTVGIWAFVRNKRLIASTGLPEYSAMAAILVGMFVNGCAESVFVMPRDMGLITNLVVFSVVVVHRHCAVKPSSRHMIRQSESDVDPLWTQRNVSQNQLQAN
jgi:O-antigen ligase